jgi:hypothetical protein
MHVRQSAAVEPHLEMVSLSFGSLQRIVGKEQLHSQIPRQTWILRARLDLLQVAPQTRASKDTYWSGPGTQFTKQTGHPAGHNFRETKRTAQKFTAL